MLERQAAVAQGRAVFERYRSGVRSSRTPATGGRAGAPATPATTRATPVTALPGGGAAEGSAQSFLLRAVASTPAPTAAHHEEAAHRREARLELGRLPSSGGGSGEEDEDEFALRHCVEFVHSSRSRSTP